MLPCHNYGHPVGNLVALHPAEAKRSNTEDALRAGDQPALFTAQYKGQAEGTSWGSSRVPHPKAPGLVMKMAVPTIGIGAPEVLPFGPGSWKLALMARRARTEIPRAGEENPRRGTDSGTVREQSREGQGGSESGNISRACRTWLASSWQLRHTSFVTRVSTPSHAQKKRIIPKTAEKN